MHRSCTTMLLSHFKGLCVLLVSLIEASPVKAAPTVAATPSSFQVALQQKVPSCAQPCVRSSLVEKFPVACTAQEDIQCLCSHYSNIGESLGEVAVGCIYSSCSTLDKIDSAYGICLGQEAAVMPSKTALTYTVVASSTPRPTASSSQKPATTTTSVTNSVSRSRSSSTQSAFADSVATLPAATASITPTSVAAATSEEAPARMTPAQIAGLSVAAVAAFVMAIGLMALSVCLRRRRERKYVMDVDEKGQRQEKRSGRFSHYVSVPEQPSRFPLAPVPAYLQGGRQTRPVQRLGVGTSNSSSNSTLPLDQIGVAISAELDGTSVAVKSLDKVAAEQKRPAGDRLHPSVPLRPFSALTQETVFEEDDAPARRRSSILLPTPPVPIAPIRNLQPSRAPPTYTTSNRQAARKSELFLNIPVRHERPQPRRIIAAQMPSDGSPKPVTQSSRPRLAPPIKMISSTSSKESVANTASSRNASNDGDIIDYYFSSSQDLTPKAGPARFTRPKDSPKAIQIKTKKSMSTVSRTASRTSTNIRDSLASQTSFETSDPNDTTPEDDDSSSDKQLSSDETKALSPVAESPISKLRYPKVPRSANQHVPRSPHSPPHTKQLRHTPRKPVEPSTLLSKRNNALPPLLLESRPRLNSPQRDPFVSPPRKARAHVRSNSTESWSTTPASKVERKSRVQSGQWGMGKSPVMYEADVVQPLNVRRKRDEMMEVNVGRDVDVDAEGLKSPVWVPRLTPTRKGNDLFISVGWGSGRP